MKTPRMSEARQLSYRTSIPSENNACVAEADASYLNSFVRGMAVSQMIGVICEVGLPDALPDKGQRSIELLANELGVDSKTLSRIGRALSAFGIFDVDAAGQIGHNGRSRMLRNGSHPSQHWAARFWTSAGVWQAWGALRHSLWRGEESFKHVHQQQFFDYIRNHSNEAESYRQYMASGYPGRHESIALMLKFAEDATVIDVGGGSGALIRALLEQNPGIAGIVYDQPEVIRNLDAHPVDRRMGVRSGNFFESVPIGGDVYILSWVLHDWPDTKA